MRAREAAYRSLLRIEKEGRYSNLEADLVLDKGLVEQEDKKLYTRLVYGTVERKLTLDYFLSPLILGKDYMKADPEVKTILRLSGYQILFSERIPVSAAVNEGVNLAKKYVRSASGLVNAVLRRLAEQKDHLRYPDKERFPLKYLSVYYSVSEELCRLFVEDMGMAECERMLEAVNHTPGTALRINTLKITPEAFVRRLEQRGIAAGKMEYSVNGVRIGTPVGELTELAEGLCFVQDEASQLAVEALDAQPGMTVIDCCCCPGGKSFGAAIEMENKGKIRCYDLHKNKLSLVEKGAEALGITVIETAEGDGRVYREELEESCDRLICDLPCSGLGVLSKKPDIRYKKAADIERLPGIQWAIINNVCRYLKKGGVMVFSTCTVLQKENDEIFHRFLKEHPEFEPVPLHFPGIQGGEELSLIHI